MTIVEMLEQSGMLTMLGMAVVFGFLIIMIICITLAGKLVHALGLDKEGGANAAVSAAAPSPAQRTADAAITAVISAAVSEYRKTNQ